MPLNAQQAVLETADYRGKRRRTLRLAVGATVRGSVPADAVIHNLSQSGLLIETPADLKIGEWIQVELPAVGSKSAQVVWTSERLFGCRFSGQVGAATISAAVLQAPFDMQESPAEEPTPAVHEQHVSDKLPLATRVWIILGLAVLSWAAVATLLAFLA